MEPVTAASALDYGSLAGLYDDYCVFDGDVAFFVDLTRNVGGHVLELMAGTGRLSLPMATAGARLTCVDSSLAMLAILRRKLDRKGLAAAVVAADVRRLSLQAQFHLVLLPFQGLTELARPQDRLDMFRAVAENLSPLGRFVCTSHNPAVRLRTVGGTWREVGEYRRSSGGAVRVALCTRFDEQSQNVVGTQRLLVTSAAGTITTVTSALRFALPSLSEIARLAERAGLVITSVCGDYSGHGYDERTSPAIIATLAKLA